MSIAMDSSYFTEGSDSLSGSKPLDLSHHLSQVTKQRLPSQMKAYYKFFAIPGVGNLAGGLPNVSFFPFDTLEAQTAPPTRWTPSALGLMQNPTNAEASHITIPKTSTENDFSRKVDLASVLQYGTAQGYPALYSFLRQFTRDVLHPNHAYDGGPEIVLDCGSTDGFNKTLELLVNPWYPGLPIENRQGLIVEKFMYSNVLSQAKPYGMNIVPVSLDNQGVLAYGPGSLDETLSNWDTSKGQRPHVMYTVTMGHNPTSGVLSVQRRREVYAVACKYDIIIVEDDPYWYLQFPHAADNQAEFRDDESLAAPSSLTEGWDPACKSGYDFIDSLVPSFLQIDTEGRVIRLDTFSKTVAPGCRLGWITAQPALVESLLRITEASTQQPSGFVQGMIAEMLIGPQQPATLSAFERMTGLHKKTFNGWNMDGWVRWLAGLNGAYEDRMIRMCRILDAGSHQLKQSTPVDPAAADWGVVTKKKLLSFDWPKGGMFIWVRLHFETHPLWNAPGDGSPVIDGPLISTALLMFLMHKPFLVVASPGTMFSANSDIKNDEGWAYFRLCFAAEADEQIDLLSQRFVDGIQKFWKIKRASEMEKYANEFYQAEQSAVVGSMMEMGC